MIPKQERDVPPAQDVPPQERRAQLLEAAYVLIAEKGLEGLRTRDVAERAHANISTLHYYFGTKDALIMAVVYYVRDKLIEGNLGRLRAQPDGKGPAVSAHIHAAWRTFQTTPHLLTVLQELALKGHRDADTRAAFQTIHGFWNSIIENLLNAGVQSGELRDDLDTHSAARVVSSFLMGSMIQLGINPKAFDFNKVANELIEWLGKAPKRSHSKRRAVTRVERK